MPPSSEVTASCSRLPAILGTLFHYPHLIKVQSLAVHMMYQWARPFNVKLHDS